MLFITCEGRIQVESLQLLEVVNTLETRKAVAICVTLLINNLIRFADKNNMEHRSRMNNVQHASMDMLSHDKVDQYQICMHRYSRRQIIVPVSYS